MEQRIIELELKFTEQQHTIQALSDVLYAQQKSLDSLQAEVNLLRKKMEAEPGIVDARSDERPPHY